MLRMESWRFANKQPQDAMKRHLTSSLGPCKRVRAEESAEEGEEEEDDVDDVEDEEEEEEEGAEPAEAVSDNDKRLSENDKPARLSQQKFEQLRGHLDGGWSHWQKSFNVWRKKSNYNLLGGVSWIPDFMYSNLQFSLCALAKQGCAILLSFCTTIM